MESRITLITLGVKDIAVSRAFYEKGLGWEASAMSADDVAFFRTNGTALALYPYEKLAEDAFGDAARDLLERGKPRFTGVTLAHNVTSRESVEAVLAEAATAGGKIVKQAHDTFWGGYSGYFADPDGHLWEVAYGEMFKYDAQGHMRLP